MKKYFVTNMVEFFVIILTEKKNEKPLNLFFRLKKTSNKKCCVFVLYPFTFDT